MLRSTQGTILQSFVCIEMSTVYRRLRPQSEDNTSYDHLDQVRVMVFNNISVILWQQVLLMEETGIPGENHRPTVSH